MTDNNTDQTDHDFNIAILNVNSAIEALQYGIAEFEVSEPRTKEAVLKLNIFTKILENLLD